MNGTDVHSTLREMWETRPARPRHDRKVAGVAAAIARRYDIDPVLVRVGFVVAAIYGIGAALYIAGWVLLPEAAEDDPTDGAAASAQPGKRPHPGLLIALVVAAVVGTGAIFGRDGGIIWPAIIALGLLFLLHRARGGRGIPGPGATSQPGPADGAPTVSLRKDGDATAQQGTTELDPVTGEPKPTPPSWDPLGAAPFAWDLPEPAPEPAPEAPAPRRRPPVTAVTLAVALVVGGVLGALLLGGAGLTSLPVLFAIVLGVLGAGLVVGAFVHAGRGIIPFALIMCLLTWGATQIPSDGLRGGIGSTVTAPETIDMVAREYDRAAGNIELDLRKLDLSLPGEGATAPAPPGTAADAVRTAASVGMGNLEVWVPANADVTLRGSAGLGHVQFGDRESGGSNARVDVVEDLGADGVRSGRPIVLDLHAGLGNVEVHRG
ncbi:PspC domain-containing protein [Pseudonocardia sp.]|uniref:PspC domain-containing protein n=2 Tax=Pseudonocardia sp. TaxID=60912 RepID=UPI003D0A64A1